MQENNKAMAELFSKKIFALLLEKAKGERSWRQFSIDADVSYVQMRKLVSCEQENPPRLKLIKKIAEVSEGGVTIDDLLFATGNIERPQPTVPASLQPSKFILNYRSLGSKDKKLVEEFCEFLATRSREENSIK